MSRWRTIALALAALAVAGGCGGSSGSSDDTGGGGTSAAPKVKVGLVTDIGGLNDRSFNFLANKGLQDAVQQLGVEGRVLESKSDADYIPNLEQLVTQKYDLTISVGFLMGDQTKQVAEAFPDAKMAIIDFAYDPPVPNIDGLVFKEQEAGYLAGYLAGKMTKSGTVSTVGGQKIPPVDHYIAGFQQGAKDANPSIKLLNGYSQDFVAQAKCKEIALEQIAQGSDVVFQVAGQCGLGALDAAKEKSVWGIGVDADQAYLGDHILTSALKRVDVAVFNTIKSVVDGTFQGGQVIVFGLAEDGVGIGEVHSSVPQDVLDEVEAQKQKIIDGSLAVNDTVP
ncbi:MAG: basic rane protein [Gaiellales bacterium]|nr:basic rane protein [Gaiellales bacterium]